MKKKLLFINPSIKESSSILSTVSYNMPQLSLISLISYTNKDKWDIEILDEVVDDFKIKDVDLVAITSVTFTINRAYEIAKMRISCYFCGR